MPLTADRAKPAVPFAGIYRLIDFALSNVVNSGYLKVVVLTQYKSHSLDRHVTQTWRMSTMLGNYVDPGAGAAAGRQALVPRQRRRDLPVAQPDPRREARHRGRGRRRPRLPDGLLADGRPAHRERRGVHGGRDPAADLAGRPVRRHRRASRTTPTRIREFLEKPTDPHGAAGQPGRGARVDGQLRLRRRRAGRGGHPRRDHRRLQARHGRRHRAGVRAPRRRPASTTTRTTWCRARPTATAATGATSGRSASYYAAHMDVVSPLPVFNLYNFEWPIYTSYGPQPPAKLVQGADGSRSRADEAVLSPGVVVSGGTCSSRCSRRRSGSAAGAHRRGLGADERRARRRRRGGPQRDPRQERRSSRPAPEIGVDQEADEKRGFLVEDGLTVLGKGQSGGVLRERRAAPGSVPSP